MIASNWKKSFRDIWRSKRRSLLVVLAIAASNFTLGVIFYTYDVIDRSLEQNFQRAKPSSVTMAIEQFDHPLMTQLQDLSFVMAVDARRAMNGEIVTTDNEGQAPIKLVLFVVPDINDMQADVLHHGPNTTQLKTGEILLERQAFSLLGAAINDNVHISLQGKTYSSKIIASTYDAMMPQAEWENTAYAYINPQTAMLWGLPSGFNQLKLILDNSIMDQQDRRIKADEISRWIEQQGIPVKSITVFKAGSHPHENITSGMFLIQDAFALLCSFMSGILVFNLISSVLAKHTKQIGVMKCLGASRLNIQSMYFKWVFILAITGIAISTPMAYLLSHVYVDLLAKMLNIDIFSYRMSLTSILVQLLCGLCIPLLAAFMPIYRASRCSITQSLLQQPQKTPSHNPPLILRALSHLHTFTPATHYSLRNVFRHPSRFLLTTLILAMGGALFIATYNIDAAMQRTVNQDIMTKNWDVSLTVKTAGQWAALSQALAKTRPLVSQEGYFHGSAKLNEIPQRVEYIAVQPKGKMLNLEILAGRWLNQKPKEVQEVVINQTLQQILKLNLGDNITTKVLNIETVGVLVGVVKTLSPPRMYTQLTSNIQRNSLFLTDTNASPYSLKREVQQLTNTQHITLSYLTMAQSESKIIADHFEIIFNLTMLLAFIVIFIAGIGIALTISTNVLERKKEIGVLKAIGAETHFIRNIFMIESTVTGLLAWVMGCLFTIPITALVQYYLGILLIKTPLTLSFNSHAFLLALPLILAAALLASLLPANAASQSSVGELLLFE